MRKKLISGGRLSEHIPYAMVYNGKSQLSFSNCVSKQILDEFGESFRCDIEYDDECGKVYIVVNECGSFKKNVRVYKYKYTFNIGCVRLGKVMNLDTLRHPVIIDREAREIVIDFSETV